nr:uncharacterized protein LOC111422322 [Onthophagus taurus]
MKAYVLIYYFLIVINFQNKILGLPVGEEAEITCAFESGIDKDLSNNVSFAIPQPIPTEYYAFLQCLYDKKDFIIDNNLDHYYMSVNAQIMGLMDQELAVVINDCVTTSKDEESVSKTIYNFDSCVGRGILPYFGYGTPLDEIASKCAKEADINEDDAVLPCVLMTESPTIRILKYWECKYEKRGYFNEDGSINYDQIKSSLSKLFTERGLDLIVDTCHQDWSILRSENVIRVEKCIGSRVINMVMHSNEILENLCYE